jgi:hypothetical protein
METKPTNDVAANIAEVIHKSFELKVFICKKMSFATKK